MGLPRAPGTMTVDTNEPPLRTRVAIAGNPAFVAWAVVAFSVLIAGCSGIRFGDRSTASETSKEVDMGQQAALRAIGGSAVSGKVRVIDRGDGAVVLVSGMNLSGAYRLAFHERGNCTSPNGFSAGPAWAPAATGKRAQDLVPQLYANTENWAEAEIRVPKLHARGADGVAGRSVMLYAGTEVPDVRPDVPNAAIACGVFEAARTPFSSF